MICPKCGKNMVEKPPTTIYASDPPQWDRVWWCGCGHEESGGRVVGKTEQENLTDLWKGANK